MIEFHFEINFLPFLYLGFEMPFGVRILRVYLTEKQYSKILQISGTSPYSSSKHKLRRSSKLFKSPIRKLKSDQAHLTTNWLETSFSSIKTLPESFIDDKDNATDLSQLSVSVDPLALSTSNILSTSNMTLNQCDDVKLLRTCSEPPPVNVPPGSEGRPEEEEIVFEPPLLSSETFDDIDDSNELSTSQQVTNDELSTSQRVGNNELPTSQQVNNEPSICSSSSGDRPSSESDNSSSSSVVVKSDNSFSNDFVDVKVLTGKNGVTQYVVKGSPIAKLNKSNVGGTMKCKSLQRIKSDKQIAQNESVPSNKAASSNDPNQLIDEQTGLADYDQLISDIQSNCRCKHNKSDSGDSVILPQRSNCACAGSILRTSSKDASDKLDDIAHTATCGTCNSSCMCSEPRVRNRVSNSMPEHISPEFNTDRSLLSTNSISHSPLCNNNMSRLSSETESESGTTSSTSDVVQDSGTESDSLQTPSTCSDSSSLLTDNSAEGCSRMVSPNDAEAKHDNEVFEEGSNDSTLTRENQTLTRENDHQDLLSSARSLQESSRSIQRNPQSIQRNPQSIQRNSHSNVDLNNTLVSENVQSYFSFLQDYDLNVTSESTLESTADDSFDHGHPSQPTNNIQQSELEQKVCDQRLIFQMSDSLNSSLKIVNSSVNSSSDMHRLSHSQDDEFPMFDDADIAHHLNDEEQVRL